MRRILAVLLCTGFAFAPVGASFAQNPQPAPPGSPTPPVAPPSAPSPPPEKVAPGGLHATPDNGKKTLSDKLSEQNGTLKPPGGVTYGMPVKTPPKTDNMPVLKPPGSAGSSSTVQPK